ncbi:hypothetical protein BD410DRAFT_796148 [Rickenella mellea]|uniref:Uncharacterized protein n=1 Tax=Rickenella mellea TaxID=50990 RepID=A0A4Y7PLG8_9AGAM|nr:hypothetical protein BD410DRAFT_796148 [Rickenella mellea]
MSQSNDGSLATRRNDTLGRVGGGIHTHIGSNETLSETISSTKPEMPGELTPPATETQFLMSPKSSTHDVGRGDNKEWKKSTVLTLLSYTAMGTLFALGHHFMYEAISHHLTFAVSLKIGPISVGPMWALTVGNAISWIVQLFFTLAIGGALVQRFWHVVHKRHFTLHEMDYVFSITSAFYTWTALRRAPGIAVVAVLSLSLGGVLSTFAPPSLSISVLPLSEPCDITTVDFSNAFTSFPSTALSNLATHILLTQSAMLPTSSPCSNCTYNVTYFAPALACQEVNITSSPFHPDTVDRITIWNGTLVPNPVSGYYDIFMMSRTGDPVRGDSFSDPQIIMCTLQNATYKADIDHRNGTSITAEMDIVPFYAPTPKSGNNVTRAYLDIGQTFGQFLSGYVELISKGNSFELDIPKYSINTNTFVAYTGWIPCAEPSFTGNFCSITPNFVATLPMLMQHMSMSLLAGSVADDNATSTLSRVPDGHCMNESAVYVYDRVRLFAVYGSALLVTSICVALGIHSIVVGQGGTLTFSNLVYAIMTPEMIEVSNGQELPQDTVVHAVKGRFVPWQMV